MADAHNAVCLNRERNSSFLPSQNKIVASWLLDYYCCVFWEEFKNERTVDKLTERNFLTGLLKQDLDVTKQRIVTVTIIEFLICLVDGVDVNAVYSEEQDETPLEIALIHLNRLTDECNLPGIDLGEIKNGLKIQAVLTCCRVEQYDVAKAVLQRIWNDETRPTDTEKATMQKRLHIFVNNKRVPPRFLEHHTYERFLDQVTVKLQKVWDQMEVPFLLQAVRRREQQVIQESDDDCANSPSIEPSSSRQNSGNSSCSSSPLKGFRRYRELMRPSPILQLNDTSDHYLTTEESGTDTGETITNKTIEHNAEANHRPSTSKSDEDIALRTETCKLSTRKNINNCNTETVLGLFTESALKKSLSRLGLSKADWHEIRTTHPRNLEPRSPRTNGAAISATQHSRRKRVFCNSPSSQDSLPKLPPSKAPNLSRSPKTLPHRNKDNSHQATAAAVNGEISPSATMERTSAAMRNDVATTSFYPSNDERPEKKETPKRGRTIHGLKYQPNRIVDRSRETPQPSTCSDISDDIDGDESSSDRSYPILSPRPLRRSLDPSRWQQNGHKLRSTRRPWSDKEVERLKEAVRRYGTGKWSEILITYKFKGRTNINLKDKWRTLVKNEEV